MIELYGIKNCDKCRAASKWLVAHGIKHQQIDVRDTPLTKTQILEWQLALGWEALVNKRSTTWKNLSDQQREELNEINSCQLLLESPTLMKRPVLVTATGIYNGFSESSYNSIFKQA
ncbi:MAG: Spx/MgsR family RNA polymerase-binding regulatory protein [Gammaproteobacteria bacterium]|nr:Spx/MgsR family RNA polymerase-binding regulatory protein [Gammaproteobacteria bacterium]